MSPTTIIPAHIALLERLDACKDARAWARGYATLDAVWAACERPDWMLWLLRKRADAVGKPVFVRLAIAFARPAVEAMSDNYADLRALARAALDAAQAWLDNPCGETAAAARAAGRVVRSAAFAADADAVDAAAHAAAHAAYSASAASAASADAVDAVDAVDAAEHAAIIRQHVPAVSHLFDLS